MNVADLTKRLLGEDANANVICSIDDEEFEIKSVTSVWDKIGKPVVIKLKRKKAKK